jgi:hypothetical protein
VTCDIKIQIDSPHDQLLKVLFFFSIVKTHCTTQGRVFMSRMTRNNSATNSARPTSRTLNAAPSSGTNATYDTRPRRCESELLFRVALLASSRTFCVNRARVDEKSYRCLCERMILSFETRCFQLTEPSQLFFESRRI